MPPITGAGPVVEKTVSLGSEPCCIDWSSVEITMSPPGSLESLLFNPTADAKDSRTESLFQPSTLTSLNTSGVCRL